MVAMFNFAFLILSVLVAGYITGEEVLSASIGPLRGIDESVMFTENEPVTFIFSTREQIRTELLNITIVDPQNIEYSWQKGFGGHNQSGIFVDDFTMFTPKSSGIHQIKISNTQQWHFSVSLSYPQRIIRAFLFIHSSSIVDKIL
ncbi:hypothetical protein [Methanosarcina sp. DH2]|uniref:hypothetical protein n=1 Tax=Methanosarcina sp. DH2 TaxID=2605639 RepID=UPI001E373785|nr:hypothetical protein [Methanosarcina sp. DH2]